VPLLVCFLSDLDWLIAQASAQVGNDSSTEYTKQFVINIGTFPYTMKVRVCMYLYCAAFVNIRCHIAWNT